MTSATKCDAAMLDGMVRALRRAALGQSVQVHIEAGVHRGVGHDGMVHAAPNGSLSFRVEINGGATDTGLVRRPWRRRVAKALSRWLEEVSEAR